MADYLRSVSRESGLNKHPNGLACQVFKRCLMDHIRKTQSIVLSGRHLIPHKTDNVAMSLPRNIISSAIRFLLRCAGLEQHKASKKRGQPDRRRTMFQQCGIAGSGPARSPQLEMKVSTLF
jgi:hypothetical protein